MAALKKIVTENQGRIAQLVDDVGSNQQARASDVNPIIDAVNNLTGNGIPAAITGTTVSASTSVSTAHVYPYTSGAGTSITIPVLAGTAYASPTVLTAAQSGAICVFNAAAGNNFTLPAATAANKGVTFKFIQTVSVTSNAAEIFAASSSDLMVGTITAFKASVDPVKYSANGSSNYKISQDGSTTGGIVGSVITVTCGGLNLWYVDGFIWQSGTVATPFAG